MLLGIGAIIGTGIFVLTGTAAANHAGPALVVSFLIAGLGCALAGLCYAEFASMIPVSGSAYSYSYATLGEFVAWFIGWNLILEYLFAAATVAVGWSGYVVSLVEQLGFHLPAALTNAPFTKGAGHFEIVRTGALINLPAVLVIAAITALCYVGIHQSARFNAIVVAIKVTVIVLFIGFGMWVVRRRQLAAVHPAEHRRVRPVRLERRRAGRRHHLLRLHRLRRGLDRGAGSEEPAARHADRHPRRASRSARCSTSRSSAVLTGMVPYTELNTPAPVALALDRHPGTRAGSPAGSSSARSPA